MQNLQNYVINELLVSNIDNDNFINEGLWEWIKSLFKVNKKKILNTQKRWNDDLISWFDSGEYIAIKTKNKDYLELLKKYSQAAEKDSNELLKVVSQEAQTMQNNLKDDKDGKMAVYTCQLLNALGDNLNNKEAKSIAKNLANAIKKDGGFNVHEVSELVNKVKDGVHKKIQKEKAKKAKEKQTDNNINNNDQNNKDQNNKEQDTNTDQSSEQNKNTLEK